MHIFNKSSNDRYIVGILFIIALIIRLAIFFNTGEHNADGMHRKILTINWLKDPYFIIGGLWPPLHFYLMAFATWLLKGDFIATKLISLISGTLVVFPYYYLVKLLFDKKIAVASTLILAFLGLHIQYSTLSMSEVPFIFFLVTSLYFFFRFKKVTENRYANLIMSAIFINLASMIRYEGWLFVPLLAILILVTDIKNIKRNLSLGDSRDILIHFIIFLIIALIFPIFWMIGNYNIYGDPFYGQSWSDNYIKTNMVINQDSQYHNPPLIKRLVAWPGVIYHKLNIISIFAILGLIISLYKKRYLEFLTIFIILMLIFTYKIVNFTMTSQARQMIMPIVFLIPYFMVGLDSIIRQKNLSKYVNGNIIVSGILIFFAITSLYTVVEDKQYVTPNYVLDVSNWLKDNLKQNETVLLDEYNWWGLHILYLSGLNTTFTEDYLTTFEYTTDQIKIVSGGGKKIDEFNIVSYLENYRPTYIIYSPNGKLGNLLNFSSNCKYEKYNDYSFECIYSTKNYNIYKLIIGKAI